MAKRGPIPRPRTWGAARQRAEEERWTGELDAAVAEQEARGLTPQQAKGQVIKDYREIRGRVMQDRKPLKRAAGGGEPADSVEGFGIDQDLGLWDGKPKISKSREVEWALNNMVFADVPPGNSPSSAAYGFYLIARQSPAQAAKFLKDHLPKTLREEVKRGEATGDDTDKLIRHTRMVEKMGSDAVHYEEKLLRKRASA